MPSATNLKASEWTVEAVGHKQALELVKRWHYARGMSNTAIFCHGLFDDLGALRGVAVWLCPTQRACRTVDPDDWKRVVALSRLAIEPSAPRNAATFLIARSVDLIRKDGRFRSLVSFADSAQGHTGLLYRAAGWTYVGKTVPTPFWVDGETGEMRAIKATKTLRVKEMQGRGWVFKGRFIKHKFVRYLDKRLHRRFCEL